MHVLTKQRAYSRLRPLPVGSLQITGGFWQHKQDINRSVSLRSGYRKLEDSGNFQNLRIAAGLIEGEYRTPVFMDSDIHKWLEAVALDLGNKRDPELEQMADEVVELLAAAQMDDGYLDSYWQVVKAGERWTDLDHGHELYCAGHMFEAAVAYHRATGKTQLLDVARRFADHIDSVFGPGKRDAAPGHPEIELALVELYRETGERRYLDLAGFFVNQRGKGLMRGYDRFGPEYHQDRVPVRETSVVEGHAVRQLYLTAGVTDLYLETGEEALLDALERQWLDMVSKKTHLTGGFGAQPGGEAFGEAYDLTSDHCYCETCASIAAMMWNWRMLLVSGEARFADLLERSLYNGFLSGVSLDGQRYFYVNPLQSRGGIERPEWYGCACCPPNVMRQIAGVAYYAVTTGSEGLQIHQYLPLSIETELETGQAVILHVETGYPWEGDVSVRVLRSDGSSWPLSLRVPAWCADATVSVNSEAISGDWRAGGYATVARAWQPGDVIELSLPMKPRLTAPHPRADAIRGTLAIERGPVVYCVEEADHAGLDLLDLRIADDSALEAEWRGDLLDGVVLVKVDGAVADVAAWGSSLYEPVGQAAPSLSRTQLTAVPYYAWANRGPGAMRVFVPRLDS